MFHIVLFQPEIPPNTGNIIRLCANCGADLHLIRPLGFELEDKLLRRAGLDYREWVDTAVYDSLQEFETSVRPGRVFAFSTKGKTIYTDITYRNGDAFLFGPETRGLPQPVLEDLSPQQVIRLPMRPGNRSLNLSNTVAIVAYHAWQQLGFHGGR